ncbi:MAG: helix-turn-helix domain-containing protein [Desulfotomaculales bacterium]
MSDKTLVIQDPVLKKGFTAIPNAVLWAPGLSLSAKALYAILLGFAWADEECFPGQDKLAAAADADIKTVRKYLNELRDYGLISWVRRGLNRPNIYYIHDLATVERLKPLILLDREGVPYPDRETVPHPDREGVPDQERDTLPFLDREACPDEEYSEEEDPEEENKKHVVVVRARARAHKTCPKKDNQGTPPALMELVGILERMAGQAMPPGFANKLSRYPVDKVAEKVAILKRYLKTNRVNDVAAFILAALEEDWLPGPGAAPESAKPLSEEKRKVYRDLYL